MQATHHCNGDLAAHTQIIDCDLALLPLPLEARASLCRGNAYTTAAGYGYRAVAQARRSPELCGPERGDCVTASVFIARDNLARNRVTTIGGTKRKR